MDEFTQIEKARAKAKRVCEALNAVEVELDVSIWAGDGMNVSVDGTDVAIIYDHTIGFRGGWRLIGEDEEEY